MSKTRARNEPIPDVVDITLYFWNEGRWVSAGTEPQPIRFHIIGKGMGTSRWRPHLIQHKDPLPVQDNKDFNRMVSTLRQQISNSVELECITITKDLFDDTSGEEE